MTDDYKRHCWLRLRSHTYEPTDWPLQYRCVDCGKYHDRLDKLPL